MGSEAVVKWMLGLGPKYTGKSMYLSAEKGLSKEGDVGVHFTCM